MSGLQYSQISVQSAAGNPYGTLNPGPAGAASFGTPTQTSGIFRDEGSLFPRNTIDAPAMAPAVCRIKYRPKYDATHCKGAIVCMNAETKEILIQCNTDYTESGTGDIFYPRKVNDRDIANGMNSELKAIEKLYLKNPKNLNVLGVLAEAVTCRANSNNYLPVAVKGVTEVYQYSLEDDKPFYAGQRVWIHWDGVSDAEPVPPGLENSNRRSWLTGVVIVPANPGGPGKPLPLVYID